MSSFSQAVVREQMRISDAANAVRDVVLRLIHDVNSLMGHVMDGRRVRYQLRDKLTMIVCCLLTESASKRFDSDAFCKAMELHARRDLLRECIDYCAIAFEWHIVYQYRPRSRDDVAALGLPLMTAMMLDDAVRRAQTRVCVYVCDGRELDADDVERMFR